MSKHSGMSRFQDLKRGFVDIGRYRYILHKFDMEPWRNHPCPICNQPFTEDPKMSFEGRNVHFECYSSPAGQDWISELIQEGM